MSASQEAALSFLVLQHVSEQKAREPIVTVTTVKSKAPKASPAPIPSKPGPISMALPNVGTLDAKGFLLAMRRATDRNEQIKLIAAFVGYDPNGNFGAQESAARTKANATLNPRADDAGPTRAESKAASRSVAGFVAGMPQHTQRKLANLMAREIVAADNLIQYEKAGRDMALSQEDRMLADGMAQVERERLAQIREDIANIPR